MTADFDSALLAGVQAAARLQDRLQRSTVVLRDVFGRVSLIIDDRDAPLAPNDLADEAVTGMVEALRSSSERFVDPEPLLLATELYGASSILDVDNKRMVSSSGLSVWVVEQYVTGAGWTSTHQVPDLDSTNTLTLFGFKGGVGRSTAGALIAWRLASWGKRVLLIDLDLESPGVGEMLLPSGLDSEGGLVDLLLGASYGDTALARRCLVRSPISDLPGAMADVYVCPAGGSGPGYEYIPRLNRSYAEIPTVDGPVSFEDRLVRAVGQLKSVIQPDITITDSRAGLHDLSAVALTRLAEVSLLFALDTPQTWAGYGTLLSWWAEHESVARRVRDRLRVVAGLVPPTRSADYLASFVDNSYATFSRIYDEVSAGDAATDLFHPQPDDEDAPHYPLPILDLEVLRGFQPLGDSQWVDDDVVKAVVDRVAKPVLTMLTGEEAPSG